MSAHRRDFLRSAAFALAATQFGLSRSAHAQVQIPGSTGEESAVPIGDAVNPFPIAVSDDDLAELRRRIATVRWPSKELVADRSQGVQLATIQELARYWTTDYDWRKCEARLNALAQFKAEIDGVDVHFIHVKSQHKDALPLIITHG
ncbi:MAG: epoxide hydrolase N-terminal domain-containing protein, partial [Chloroflexi bacterium]|nr:epoxide hydrolase N-terminal domain-containing protein [Chloroflexota bacterium]